MSKAIKGLAAIAVVAALAGCSSEPTPVQVAVPATERPASGGATVPAPRPTVLVTAIPVAPAPTGMAAKTASPAPTGAAVAKTATPSPATEGVAVGRTPSNICQAEQQVGTVIDSGDATHVISGDRETEATNVRLGPSLDSGVDCAIYNGVKVKALEVQGDWTKISYEWTYKIRGKSLTGWMWSAHLRKI
jgi:Bacterial SH3 domain